MYRYHFAEMRLNKNNLNGEIKNKILVFLNLFMYLLFCIKMSNYSLSHNRFKFYLSFKNKCILEFKTILNRTFFR